MSIGSCGRNFHAIPPAFLQRSWDLTDFGACHPDGARAKCGEEDGGWVFGISEFSYVGLSDVLRLEWGGLWEVGTLNNKGASSVTIGVELLILPVGLGGYCEF